MSWFKRDLCTESRNRLAEKNVLLICRLICKMRSFRKREFIVWNRFSKKLNRISRFAPQCAVVGSAHWSILVKKWQKLFQVKMAPNFTKFEWYQQWKASQGLKNWLKAIKAIKATVQARYEKKLKFHNFFQLIMIL